METRVTNMTTGRVPVETWPAASLHQRSMAEGVTVTTMTCVTSSMIGMHAIRFRTGAESGSAMSSAMTRTMIIMVLFMTNFNGSAVKKGDTFQEVSRIIPET
jgi:hypothetical protein